MSEFSANAVQVVNPGETVIFTDSTVPNRNGLVRHRDDTGNFLLSGFIPQPSCRLQSASYLVDFGANISVPTGGTAGPISLAFAIDGVTIPATNMIVTPAAVEQYFNVSRAANVEIWNGCCESVTIRNTSDQPIQVQNANIIFARPELD